MSTIRRILAATDFSAGADAAIERAVQIALAHGAAIDLMHAYDAAALASLQAVFDVQRLRGETPDGVLVREQLEQQADALARRSGLAVAAVHAVGTPAEAIARQVRSQPAALAVLARRADPQSPGIGSTLMRVLREAPCPVLVVAHAGTGPYERVLVAADLRDRSQRAAEIAAALFPGADFRLLCALDPAWERMRWQRVGRPGAPGTPVPAAGAVADLREHAGRELQAMARQLARTLARPPSTEIVSASAGPAIVEHARTWLADCIAVGRHGQGAIADRLLGSTTLDVIHHGGRDVLVVG